MKKIIAQEQTAWVTAVSDWLQAAIKEYKATSLYVPAGESPKLIYRDWEQSKPAYLNNLKLIQIDDVLTGKKKNLFKDFFYEELPSYADRIEYFESGKTQAELGILGIGLNGHVAFHEPGLPANFYSGCVQLQEVTRNNLDLENPTWGKTYGAGAFYNCKALLVIVKGIKTREILMQTLAPNSQVPAAGLMKHPDITILSDFEF